jgi:group II intron reverse transcriptase/maturase
MIINNNIILLKNYNHYRTFNTSSKNKNTEILNNNKQIITYQEIISIDNLNKGLARTKSNVSPGLDGEVKANFTNKKIEDLQKSLKSQRFKPTPVKRVLIPKPDGGTRPLGVASQKDKVVQAAILNKLEPVLENIFMDCSYGGRPNKNCHHALKVIKTKWQNVTWIINIDVQKYFDTINHDILLKMLEEYVDQATLELIRKFLKCGYIDFYNHPNTLEKSEIGTLQGSLISPIMANLYLHHLDQFIVDKLIPEWNRGDVRKHISGYQTRKLLTAEEQKLVELVDLKGLKEAISRLKHNEWVKKGLPARDPKDDNFRRMYYARYVDDFIIGFTGSKVEAEELKSSIEAFLLDELQLKTNETKSYISHSSNKGIKYLGFFIRYISNNKIVKDPRNPENDGKGLGHQLKSTAINSAQLRIPTELILRRAVDSGYGKIRKGGSIRPSSCRKLSSLDDKLIVNRFSSIIRGLMAYYSPANKFSNLWQIVAFYRKSCALTLADKHKLKTAAKAFKIFGPKLRISNPVKKKETELFYPTTLKTTGNFKLGKSTLSLSDSVIDPIKGSYKQNKKSAKTCQWPHCDRTEGLEEHHVNPVRTIKGKNLSEYQRWLRKKQRKTVTLCREHHLEAEKLYREK